MFLICNIYIYSILHLVMKHIFRYKKNHNLQYSNNIEIIIFSLFIVSEKYYLCTRFARVVIPVAIGIAGTTVRARECNSSLNVIMPRW